MAVTGANVPVAPVESTPLMTDVIFEVLTAVRRRKPKNCERNTTNKQLRSETRMTSSLQRTADLTRRLTSTNVN